MDIKKDKNTKKDNKKLEVDSDISKDDYTLKLYDYYIF